MSVCKVLLSNVYQSSKLFKTIEVASVHTAVPYFAARKGTRARKESKKVKLEIKKEAWAPESKKKKALHKSRKVDESGLVYPEDDIYFQKDYKMRVFQFAEAISAIRETHHPSMYNVPNAYLGVTIEISTTTHLKKIKYIDPFTHIVSVEHPFDHGEDRTILAFCKEHEMAEKLQEMGLAMVGDVATIKGIEKGVINLPEFQYVVCNPKILPDLMHIRGLLKKKLPTLKNNTLGNDLIDMVQRLQTGIKYSMKKDSEEPDFGYSDFHIGRVSMPIDQLEDNLKRVLQDINIMRPNSKPEEEEFITRMLLWSEPSPEKLKIDFTNLIDAPEVKDIESDDEEEMDLELKRDLLKASKI